MPRTKRKPNSDDRNLSRTMQQLTFSPKSYSTQKDKSTDTDDSLEDDINIMFAQSNRSTSQGARYQRIISPTRHSQPSSSNQSGRLGQSTSLRPQSSNKARSRSLPQRRSARRDNTPEPVAGPSGRAHSRKNRPISQEVRALNEIKKYQKSIINLIPKLSFGRVIKELLQKYSFDNEENQYVHRITAEALNALQESTEMYLAQLFADAYLCSAHRGRVTLLVKDMELVLVLRGQSQ